MIAETQSEDEPQLAQKKNREVLIAWAIIIGVFLFTICVGSYLWFTRLKAPARTVSSEFQSVPLPTSDQSTSEKSPPASIDRKFIGLPLIQSGHLPVWKVTNVKSLGYKLGGNRYDLATFVRSDNQATAQGYCINRGWDVPALGSEYWLTAGDIFIPLHEPKANTIQRFQRIK